MEKMEPQKAPWPGIQGVTKKYNISNNQKREQ